VTYKAGKLSQVESNKATDVPLVTRTYDGEGRLSSVTDAAGTVTTYTYQGSTNLVASVTQVMNGTPSQTFVTSYTYDNLGRQTKTLVGASSSAGDDYAYTSLGQVEQVTDPAHPRCRRCCTTRSGAAWTTCVLVVQRGLHPQQRASSSTAVSPTARPTCASSMASAARRARTSTSRVASSRSTTRVPT
jgi:YD repeat-containing protein